MLRCRATGLEYYYDASRCILRFSAPVEIAWPNLMRVGEKQGLLGFGDEWLVLREPGGNLFYKNRVTGDYEWERPLEAVDVPPKMKFCTAYMVSPCMLYAVC
jgi:hypothetical protein